MRKQMILLTKQVISEFLVVVMLFNLVVPSFAQTTSVSNSKPSISPEELEQTLITAVEEPESLSLKRLMEPEAYSPLPVVRTLHALRAEVLGRSKISLLNSKGKQDPQATEEDFHNQFLEQYYKAVEEEVMQGRNKVKAYEAQQRKYIEEEIAKARQYGLSESTISAWQAEQNKLLEQTVQANSAKITAWRTQSRHQADDKWKEAKQHLEKEGRQQLSNHIRHLMELYSTSPDYTRPYLIDISAAILLSEGKNTTLFTADEKKILHNIYLQEVSENKYCPKETAQKESDSCLQTMNAVVGLGILGEGIQDSGAISEFVSKIIEGPNAASGLLTGVGSLLAMHAYSAVRGIVQNAINREWKDNVDFLSVSSWVETFANINGQYYGEISKWAQFPNPSDSSDKTVQKGMGNAWEEVAYMLAADGSAEALEILHTYGIGQCGVNIKADFHDTPVIACGGIQPFLVGAILSGKSGVYEGPAGMELNAGSYLNRNGRTHFVTPAQAQSNRSQRTAILNKVNQIASSQGLSVQAAIVRNMYLKSMGDLDADSQLTLDQKLFAFFQKETQNQRGLAQNIRLTSYDRDSAEYRAKAQRQHRVATWRKVGFFADIAILVWCAWDLTRLGYKAFNMGRSAYTAMKMARAGTPTAARAAFLWRTKTARNLTFWKRGLPARIKNAMAPSVQNMLPQFTNVQPLLEVPGGSVPSLLDVALPSVKVAEGGAMTVNTAQVTASLGTTPAVLEGTADLQRALGTAVERANKAFVGENTLSTRLFGKGNRFYRSLLSREVSTLPLETYRYGDRARLISFASTLASNPAITVPESVRLQTSMPLINPSGKINWAVLQAAISPIVASTTSQNRADMLGVLNKAQENAGLQFTHRGWFDTWKTSLLGQNQKTYNQLLADNIVRLMDQEGVLGSFSAEQRPAILSTLAATIRDKKQVAIPADIEKYAALQYEPVRIPYTTVHSSLFEPGVSGQVLPFNFRIDRGVNGVSSTGSYQRVLFSKKGGQYFVGLTDGISAPTNLSNFKIDMPSYSLPALVRGLYAAAPAVPLELKLTPYSSRAFAKMAKISGEAIPQTASGSPWYSRLWAARRSKTNIWTDEVPVFIRQADGTEVSVPLLIKADRGMGLSNSRFVLGTDNQMHLFNGTEDLFQKHLFRFSLPKQQITTLVGLGKAGAFTSPLNFIVKSGRNKMLPLYLATGLSLSSASVGLIAPLETTYHDRITDSDKTLISLAFPYLPSLFAPALSPIVMRFGALRMVQFSLGSVALGLAFAWYKGFNGNLDQNNLPPIWPLFMSGTAIGVSSALSRSGLNILIDTMGGGGSLLKSMAFKNLGSLFLLAPSFAYGAYKLSVQPKIQGKQLSEEQRAKPATDFSLAFPVLTTVTLGVLTYLSTAKIDPGIGRSAGVLNGEKFRFWSEMGQAWKTTFAHEALPLSAAAFFFTGFEASAFGKASNQALRPMYEDREFVKNYVPGNRKNLVALLTGGTVALVPFITRMSSKPTLNFFNDPKNPATQYKRMLAASYTLNTLGGLTLMSYGYDDNPSIWKLGLGIGLMGFGTANVTQSLQKLANIRIGSGTTISKLTQGMEAAATARRAAELRTMTMTGFSWSQIGLAAIPFLQSRYVDSEVASGVTTSSKGPLTSLWIPLTSLGLSIGFAAPHLGMSGVKIPTGVFGVGKLMTGGLQSFSPLPYAKQGYQMYRDWRAGRFESKLEEVEQEAAEQAEKDAASEKTAQVSDDAAADTVPAAEVK